MAIHQRRLWQTHTASAAASFSIRTGTCLWNGVFDSGGSDQGLIRRGDTASVLREESKTILAKPGKLLRRAALIIGAVRPCNFIAEPLRKLSQWQHARAANAAKKEWARALHLILGSIHGRYGYGLAQ